MSESMAYIGRRPCGCIVFAIMDNPEHRKDVARELGKAIREGLTVERVAAEVVRQSTFGCCHKPERKERRDDKQQRLLDA